MLRLNCHHQQMVIALVGVQGSVDSTNKFRNKPPFHSYMMHTAHFATKA